MSDSEKALERILLMLPRTEANGASEHEADAAAKHIGRLIMKFPELLAGFYQQSQSRRKRPYPKQRSNKEVVFRHSGIMARTETDILICIRGNEAWVSLSKIIKLDADYISMPEWLAEAKGFA